MKALASFEYHKSIFIYVYCVNILIIALSIREGIKLDRKNKEKMIICIEKEVDEDEEK